MKMNNCCNKKRAVILALTYDKSHFTGRNHDFLDSFSWCNHWDWHLKGNKNKNEAWLLFGADDIDNIT